ncbi:MULTISPECIES: glutathione S-transferase family protein [Xanthobacter]|uniref:glutathione S-transferase family protein n=1 Tax=Xanthobacter TaxID=279 RepID=UPI001F30AA09|nr:MULTISPECIES: glutathione S-transferase family protein [unclassified Xanthobacter]
MHEARLTLYELAGADLELRFSPHCWKTRMALAHKGLVARCLPWHFTEKSRIAFTGLETVPVLEDRNTAIGDSWQIAQHLEQSYPDRPSLFGPAAALPLTAFVNQWVDATLLPAMARILLLDIHRLLIPEDQTYFRASREARFGATLEDIVAPVADNLHHLRQSLAPLRRQLRSQPYLAGATPAYADYCVFGLFMWARCTSSREVLTADDPIDAWRNRLLDAFGGMARSATRPFLPCVGGDDGR